MDSLWNISSIFKRRPTVQIRQRSVLVFLPALSSWAALETCRKAQTNSSKKKTDHCDLKGSIRLDCSQPSPQEWSLTKYRGQLFIKIHYSDVLCMQSIAVYPLYSALCRVDQSGSTGTLMVHLHSRARWGVLTTVFVWRDREHGAADPFNISVKDVCGKVFFCRC